MTETPGLLHEYSPDAIPQQKRTTIECFAQACLRSAIPPSIGLQQLIGTRLLIGQGMQSS